MEMPRDELVVLDIAGSSARVMCDVPETKSALEALGFLREDDQLVRRIIDDTDRQTLVRELIGMNALFAAGRDWSPSELVDFYREQGFISRGYRMITWTNPENYLIVER